MTQWCKENEEVVSTRQRQCGSHGITSLQSQSTVTLKPIPMGF